MCQSWLCSWQGSPKSCCSWKCSSGNSQNGNVLRGIFGLQWLQGVKARSLRGVWAQEFTGEAKPGAAACLSVWLGADLISWAAAQGISGTAHISLAEPAEPSGQAQGEPCLPQVNPSLPQVTPTSPTPLLQKRNFPLAFGSWVLSAKGGHPASWRFLPLLSQARWGCYFSAHPASIIHGKQSQLFCLCINYEN